MTSLIFHHHHHGLHLNVYLLQSARVACAIPKIALKIKSSDLVRYYYILALVDFVVTFCQFMVTSF